MVRMSPSGSSTPVSRAYERTGLIGTSYLPFENWTEALGSERLTGTMVAHRPAQSSGCYCPKNGPTMRFLRIAPNRSLPCE